MRHWLLESAYARDVALSEGPFRVQPVLVPQLAMWLVLAHVRCLGPLLHVVLREIEHQRPALNMFDVADHREEAARREGGPETAHMSQDKLHTVWGIKSMTF